MKLFIKTFFCFLIFVAVYKAQPLIKTNPTTENLKDGFDSIINSNEQENYWIGYFIQSDDGKRISIGSIYNDKFGDMTFEDVVNNTSKFVQYSNGLKPKNGKIRKSYTIINGLFISSRELNNRTAILFRYDKNAKSAKDFSEIAVCNFDHFIDLYSYPVFWLDKIEKEKSARFLIDLYGLSQKSEMRNELISPIGIHNDSREVFDFLKIIVESDNDIEEQEDAVFWIGNQANKEALNYLKTLVESHSSMDIREEAVTSLSFQNLPEATEQLINIARNNRNDELREEAIFGLGNKAVKRAEEALKDFVENDPDIEIKKRAVYALANNGNDNLDFLINIAKSNNSLSLRKSAIYSICNIDNRKVVDVLVELVKQ
ncbi:MAG: HEAT repeat domain-containing protein [Melioribacteraceae bacterium]|nr:HEAT repeat domain-containing protein [Melioribacteraceae bacterium]MCF8262989.1 HEAT repeat domain-containing protein [Melioribacteraceae bacterium]MCF8430578.1 HEAT repeat domain-containing protein [Melioribacteraceae bacterium]